MKPLHWIALGVLVIALSAPVGPDGGYDLFADPVGWLFVLLGVIRLPVGQRTVLAGAGTVAALVAVLLYVPAIATAVQDGEPALAWAVNLPQIVFTVLLGQALAARAAAPDPPAARWWRAVIVVQVLVAVLPVLVFGGGVDALRTPTYVAAGLGMLLLVFLALSHAAREWAQPTAPTATGHV